MQSSNKTLIWLTALLGVLLIITPVVLWKNSGNQSEKGPPTILVCPECRTERPYDKVLVGKTCAQCKHGRLEGAAHSARESVRIGSFYRDPLSLALVVLTCSLAIIHLSVFFYTHARSRKAEEEEYYCRCTKCKRRLRYVAKRYPRKILCPNCKTELDIPATT